MKKIISNRLKFRFGGLLLSLICLTACKKENVNHSRVTGKKYAINFNFNGFTQTTEGFQSLSATSPINSSVKVLEYLVYDSTGAQVRWYRQGRSGDIYREEPYGNPDVKLREGTFGTITDSLQSGTYTIVVVGSDGSVDINGPVHMDVSDHRKLNEAAIFHEFETSPDIFFKKIIVAVGHEDITQSLTLERIVGKLEIVIEDAIPSDASMFEISTSDLRDYSFQTEKATSGRGGGYYLGFLKDVSSMAGTTNLTFSGNILRVGEPLRVHIQVLNEAGITIYERDISNVTVQRNKKTVLKGKLFSSSASQTIKINVNDQWDDEVTNLSF